MKSAKKKFRYETSGSPNHMQKVANFFKQLRDSKDFRSCDVVLELHNSRELIHSPIAAAHSDFLADKLKREANRPLIVDMTDFNPVAVKNVVDWMYYGNMESSPQILMDHLMVAQHLGVIYLHRQLEMSLKLYGEEDPIVALNIGTTEKTGVTSEIVSNLGKVVVNRKKNNQWRSEDTPSLNESAIEHLLRQPSSQTDKMLVINVALDWLRCEGNLENLDRVIGQTNVVGMSAADQTAFQRTLCTLMRNPHTRHSLSVGEKNGYLAVLGNNSDCVTHSSSHTPSALTSPTRTSISQEKTASDRANRRASQMVIGKYHIPPREIEEIADLPPDEDVFGSVNRDEVLHRRSLSQPFRTRKRSFTDSEIKFVNDLPDVFGKESGHVPVNYSKSELQEINMIPNCFTAKSNPCSGYGNMYSGGPRSPGRRTKPHYTQSEIEEINGLQSVFSPKKCYFPTIQRSFPRRERYLGYPGNPEDVAPVKYSKSEIDEIAQLQDCFGDKIVLDKSNIQRNIPMVSESRAELLDSIPNVFDRRRPARITQSEIQEISRLPCLFTEQNSTHRSESNDQKFVNRTVSEIQDINGLPNVFSERNVQPHYGNQNMGELKTYWESGRDFGEKPEKLFSVEDLHYVKGLPDPFGPKVAKCLTNSMKMELDRLPCPFGNKSGGRGNRSSTPKTSFAGENEEPCQWYNQPRNYGSDYADGLLDPVRTKPYRLLSKCSTAKSMSNNSMTASEGETDPEDNMRRAYNNDQNIAVTPPISTRSGRKSHQFYPSSR